MFWEYTADYQSRLLNTLYAGLLTEVHNKYRALMKNKLISFYIIIFLLIPQLQLNSLLAAKTSYIRYNQVGYLINNQKVTSVGSKENLEGE